MARIAFDEGDFPCVVSLLSTTIDQRVGETSEEDELIDRAMLAVSLQLTGQHASAASQISRVSYLARVAGGPDATEFLAKLAAAYWHRISPIQTSLPPCLVVLDLASHHAKVERYTPERKHSPTLRSN